MENLSSSNGHQAKDLVPDRYPLASSVRLLPSDGDRRLALRVFTQRPPPIPTKSSIWLPVALIDPTSGDFRKEKMFPTPPFPEETTFVRINHSEPRDRIGVGLERSDNNQGYVYDLVSGFVKNNLEDITKPVTKFKNTSKRMDTDSLDKLIMSQVEKAVTTRRPNKPLNRPNKRPMRPNKRPLVVVRPVIVTPTPIPQQPLVGHSSTHTITIIKKPVSANVLPGYSEFPHPSDHNDGGYWQEVVPYPKPTISPSYIDWSYKPGTSARPPPNVIIYQDATTTHKPILVHDVPSPFYGYRPQKPVVFPSSTQKPICSLVTTSSQGAYKNRTLEDCNDLNIIIHNQVSNPPPAQPPLPSPPLVFGDYQTGTGATGPMSTGTGTGTGPTGSTGNGNTTSSVVTVEYLNPFGLPFWQYVFAPFAVLLAAGVGMASLLFHDKKSDKHYYSKVKWKRSVDSNYLDEILEMLDQAIDKYHLFDPGGDLGWPEN